MNELPALARAIALVMEEERCDASTAAHALRKAADDDDTTLTALAEKIVAAHALEDGEAVQETRTLAAPRA